VNVFVNHHLDKFPSSAQTVSDREWPFSFQPELAYKTCTHMYVNAYVYYYKNDTP
jgi:hypothetical protein